MDQDRWLTLRHVDGAGALDLHRTEGVAITIITAIFSHLTADAHRNHGPCDRAIVTIRSPEALSDGGDINRDFLQIGRLAMELPDGGSSDSRSRSDGHGDV